MLRLNERANHDALLIERTGSAVDLWGDESEGSADGADLRSFRVVNC